MKITDEMLDRGQHLLSQWLNDNAPIGEARYRAHAKALFEQMFALMPAAVLATPEGGEIAPVAWRYKHPADDYWSHSDWDPDPPPYSPMVVEPLYLSPTHDLEARLERAEKALEPFAEAARQLDSLVLGPDIDHWPLNNNQLGEKPLTLGHLREALAALSGATS